MTLGLFILLAVLWGLGCYPLVLAIQSPEGWAAFYPLLFAPFLVEFMAPKSRFSWWAAFHLVLLAAACWTGMWAVAWIAAFGLLETSLRSFGMRMGWRWIPLLAVCPPFLLKLDILAGYHLRDWSSSLAVKMLARFDSGVSRVGNAIAFHSHVYYVEKLCEGLQTFSALVLLMLLLASSYDATGSRWRRLMCWTPMLVVPAVLWFLANSVRIAALVFLDIPAEAAAHEWVGILSFLCVVAFPAVVLAECLLRRQVSLRGLPNQAAVDRGSVGTKNGAMAMVMVMAVGVLLCTQLAQRFRPTPAAVPDRWPAQIGTFQRIPAMVDGKVLQLPEVGAYRDHDNYLILKLNLNPFRFSHHPLQCWTAIGYQVVGEKSRQTVDGQVRDLSLTSSQGQRALTWYYLWRDAQGVRVSDSEFQWRLAAAWGGAKVIQVNVLRRTESSNFEEAISLSGIY